LDSSADRLNLPSKIIFFLLNPKINEMQQARQNIGRKKEKIGFEACFV